MSDSYFFLNILYISMFILNTGANLIAYKKTKYRVYIYNTTFWFGIVFNFITQMLLKDPVAIGLSMGVLILTSYSLVKILEIKAGLDIPLKKMIKPLIGLIALSIALSFTGNFTLYSYPIIFVSILPYFYVGKKNLLLIWKTSDFSGKLVMSVTLLSSIHLLDYPFLRMTSFSETGFYVQFIFIFNYLFLVNKITQDIYLDFMKEKIRILNEEKDLLVKSQATAGIMASLSHEVNSSLQIIQSSIELLKENPSNNPKFFKLIDRSLENIKNVHNLFKNSQDSKSNNDTVSLKSICTEVESFLQAKDVFEVHGKDSIISNRIVLTNVLTNLTKSILKENKKLELITSGAFLKITLNYEAPVDFKTKEYNSYIIAQTMISQIKGKIEIRERSLDIFLPTYLSVAA